MLKVFVVLLLLAFVQCQYSDVFSSTDSLNELFDKEIKIAQRLDTYIASLDRKIKKLDWFLETYYSHKNHDLNEDDMEDYISNPINAYILLKRTSLEWPLLRDVLFNDTIEKASEDLSEGLMRLPSDRDIEGASNGLFLLQETYNLNVSSFLRGTIKISNKSLMVFNESVGVLDLEILGKLAFNRRFYDRAYEWLSAAEREARLRKESNTVINRISQSLKIVIKYHDEILESKSSPRGPNWKTFVIPLNPKLALKKKYLKILKENGGRKEYAPKIRTKTKLKDYEVNDQFKALCRGEKVEVINNLSCSEVHYNDPFLKLKPFKLEVINEDPYIGIFVDFLFEKEMDALIQYSLPKLERSRHYTKTKKEKASLLRTSKQIWLREDNDISGDTSAMKIATDISTRIALATNFKTKTDQGGEAFQIANYGIGGLYDVHMDSGGSRMAMEKSGDLIQGDRIATVMGYLSDVKVGGSTVFPLLGVEIKPQKGSVVMWYNTNRHEEQDFFALHGGCPVLSGSKWILNKWIRANWQWNALPCSLKR